MHAAKAGKGMHLLPWPWHAWGNPAAESFWPQNQAEILGKVKGKNVSMVMHHSRNSQQKAWDETLVLALAGMGRLLRSHFGILAVMPAFEQVSSPEP